MNYLVFCINQALNNHSFNVIQMTACNLNLKHVFHSLKKTSTRSCYSRVELYIKINYVLIWKNRSQTNKLNNYILKSNWLRLRLPMNPRIGSVSRIFGVYSIDAQASSFIKRCCRVDSLQFLPSSFGLWLQNREERDRYIWVRVYHILLLTLGDPKNVFIRILNKTNNELGLEIKQKHVVVDFRRIIMDFLYSIMAYERTLSFMPNRLWAKLWDCTLKAKTWIFSTKSRISITWSPILA